MMGGHRTVLPDQRPLVRVVDTYVDGGLLGRASIDLDKFVVRAGRADLESFDFATTGRHASKRLI